MLRLLFLCLIVTLRGVAASSEEEEEESEGSADLAEGDDEDLFTEASEFNPFNSPPVRNVMGKQPSQQSEREITNVRQGSRFITPETDDPVDTNKATGEKAGEDGFTTIVIIVAVSVVALSIAVIVAVVLVRRRMHNRPQGIYSVPAEQGMKGTV